MAASRTCLTDLTAPFDLCGELGYAAPSPELNRRSPHGRP